MPRRSSRISPARARSLATLLDRFERAFDREGRLSFDPVELPRRYAEDGDREVAGLFAAALAYGRADLFRPRIEAVLTSMAPSPASFCDRFADGPPADPFAGFRYRFNVAADLSALAAGIGQVRRLHGSLGARFATLLAEQGGAPEPLRRALARFARELREAPAVEQILGARGPRGLAHLLPDPDRGGACKRWNLYLRWMVRGPDEIDLGTWRHVPRSLLIVPLDTHVARISRCLGLTRRTDFSWRTAEEITEGLRRLDPDDPVRFDFAMCHMGMSGACPARRDPKRCSICPFKAICRAESRSPRRVARRRTGIARAGTSSRLVSRAGR